MKISSDDLPAQDIQKVVYDILKQSKSFDVFPTPVDQIVQYAELSINRGLSLHDIPEHYFSKSIDKISNILSKVFGVLDTRKKTIYLNPDLNDGKKAFVNLHEVGHYTLPWQRDILQYVDDEYTLDPETQESFEAEANFFASAALFQMDRFEHEASKLPLCLTSIKYLKHRFGGSMQATMRRYVETSTKKVALLVLHLPENGVLGLSVRNWFTSKKFASAFPGIKIPEKLSFGSPVMESYINRKRWIDNPIPIQFDCQDETVEFEYRYFNNCRNLFILITPPGEKIHSNTTIIVPG